MFEWISHMCGTRPCFIY